MFDLDILGLYFTMGGNVTQHMSSLQYVDVPKRATGNIKLGNKGGGVGRNLT